MDEVPAGRVDRSKVLAAIFPLTDTATGIPLLKKDKMLLVDIRSKPAILAVSATSNAEP